MKTIHVEHIESAEAMDGVVPANGSRLFSSECLGVPLLLKSIRVVGASAGGPGAVGCPLRATEVLVVDLDAEEGAIHRKHAIGRGGALEGLRVLDVCESFLVRVENSSSAPWAARPVAVGTVCIQGHICGGADPRDTGDECFVPLHARPDITTARHLRIPAGGELSFGLDFPCVCDIRCVTTRSDSALDVAFKSLQIANVSLISGGRPALPVEFFYEGRETRLPRMVAANRMTGVLVNRSKEERYVEIDVAIEGVRRPSEDGARPT